MSEEKKESKEILPILRYPKEPTRWSGRDINDFMIWTTEQGTSDVTIQSDEQIICEIHGRMYRVTNRRLTHSELVEIVSKIYESDAAIAQLNSGKDVDLGWNIKIDRNNSQRYRVNITAVNNGFQITIRTITSRAPLLESMNVPQDIINNISHSQGLIMVVGATGSGKTTFMASALDWRMRQLDAHIKILFYEAPIEYVFDEVDKPTASVAQTEIGKHLPNFAAGVRNALRRKPSVIVMGEMRDEETIGEGITASMTGHLVFGTLHANGVPDCIRRMINVFQPGERNARALDILSSLKMVVGQQLLKTVDGKRVAIREYLVFNEDILDELLSVPIDNITYECRKILLRDGRTFLQDATDKYNEGIIPKSEYEKVRMATKGAVKDMIVEASGVENASEIVEKGISITEQDLENIKLAKQKEELELLKQKNKKLKDNKEKGSSSDNKNEEDSEDDDGAEIA